MHECCSAGFRVLRHSQKPKGCTEASVAVLGRQRFGAHVFGSKQQSQCCDAQQVALQCQCC
ncbi:hypothetical protein TorRG33x02_330050, partial [Trema orientale]